MLSKLSCEVVSRAVWNITVVVITSPAISTQDNSCVEAIRYGCTNLIHRIANHVVLHLRTSIRKICFEDLLDYRMGVQGFNQLTKRHIVEHKGVDNYVVHLIREALAVNEKHCCIVVCRIAKHRIQITKRLDSVVSLWLENKYRIERFAKDVFLAVKQSVFAVRSCRKSDLFELDVCFSRYLNAFIELAVDDEMFADIFCAANLLNIAVDIHAVKRIAIGSIDNHDLFAGFYVASFDVANCANG